MGTVHEAPEGRRAEWHAHEMVQGGRTRGKGEKGMRFMRRAVRAQPGEKGREECVSVGSVGRPYSGERGDGRASQGSEHGRGRGSQGRNGYE